MFFKAKRGVLIVFFVLVLASLYVAADSDTAYWTRAYCLYSSGAGAYACDSGQIAGSNASCSAVQGTDCAQEGDIYCYAQANAEEVGIVTTGPVTAYNVDWDADSTDCSCKGGTWGLSLYEAGANGNCCGDDSGETAITRDCQEMSESNWTQMGHIQGDIGDSGGTFYACDIDPSDTVCCNGASKCVYNGVCYDDGYVVDIDGDGIVESCVAHSPGTWVEVEEICDNGIDDNGNNLTDCEDPFCQSSIYGVITDTDSSVLVGAVVELSNSSLDVIQSAVTNSTGQYRFDSVECAASYVLSAKKTALLTASYEFFSQPQDVLEVNLRLGEGTYCEPDCTYNVDSLCHADCDGVNGCSFVNDTAIEKCDLAGRGWIRDYSADKKIECCEGLPYSIQQSVQAEVQCSKENLIEVVKIINYKGKPVKLVVVTCGE